MKGIDLYEAIGGISDRYIEETDQAKRIFPFRSKTFATVASAVVILVLATSTYEVTHRGHHEDASIPETATVTREISIDNSAGTLSAIVEEDMTEDVVEDVADGVAEIESFVNEVSVQYEGIVYREQACHEITDIVDISAYGKFTLVGHIGESNLSIIEGMVETGDLYIEEATGTLALVTEKLIYLLIKES